MPDQAVIQLRNLAGHELLDRTGGGSVSLLPAVNVNRTLKLTLRAALPRLNSTGT